MENFESLLIIMVVIWVAGKLFRAISLPVIFGELLGGIIVGPMVLGIIQPEAEMIKILAELGIFFLMLHSGLETNPRDLLSASKKSILVAIGGFLLPFAAIFGLFQFLDYSINESLFLAVGLSTTAIAITVRLFKDYKIRETKTANITLGAAVINDIVTLIVFSVILNYIETGSMDFQSLSIFIAKVIIFFAVIIVGGLKISQYCSGFFKNKGFTLTLIIALFFGLIAEWIGLHIIIGAFLAGLFIRQECLDEKVFNKIEDRIYGLSYSFLGPIFFASLAFHLDFSAVFTSPWLLLGVVGVAFLSKMVGTFIPALLQKISIKNSTIIGVAMNSRGAVELVIASIGYQTGIIGEKLFSILVITAFITTFLSLSIMRPLAKFAKN